MIALNWGTDPLGNRQFILLDFVFSATAGTDNPQCLPLRDVCQNYLGQDTVQGYFQPKWNGFYSKLANPSTTYLRGLAPELLFLYDFSGNNTLPVAQTVPPGLLDPSVVIPVPYNPYTNVFKFINQYDAGSAFGLPKKGSQAGANACGPTSLTMAMNAAGYLETNIKTVYANTMELGLTGNDVTNGFYPDRALDWLKDKASFKQIPFPNPSPLPARAPIHERWDGLPQDIVDGWAAVDNLLKNYKQPIVFRTDLGGHRGGHIILLLGVGHSDDLAVLYGDGYKGDYYIVADPAGHLEGPNYYNSINLEHYSDSGVNYGGWFAMYPKEDLVGRITKAGIPQLSTLTFGKPLVSNARVSGHSPMTIIITDPFGNRTGIQTNGTVLNNIPQSFYEPPIAEEEDGPSMIDPDGPKTVQIENPEGGPCEVELIGTNTGPYTLDWEETGADGTALTNGSFTGTITLGQHIKYTLNFLPTGAPKLHSTPLNRTLVLSWLTNASGYTLQTTTNLSDTNSWMGATNAVAVSNAIKTAVSATTTPRRYFRLKK